MKRIIIKEDAASPPKPVEDREVKKSEESEEYRRRHMLPQELAEIIWPAIQAGGLMGKSSRVLRRFPILVVYRLHVILINLI
jgi:hypothetical protein